MSTPKNSKLGPGSESATLIYVVDDEPMLLELAAIILEPMGYEVRTFRDPQEALRAFAAARRRPDLLITDYAMHSLNGLALIEACRRIAPEQKILMLSGTVGAEIFEQEPCKPDQFLAKPYHAQQLLDMVKALVSG
jgi:DNA-binding NtrC family response regulator